MSLAISLRSEILKTKRTASLYLMLVASAVIPLIFVLDAISDGISPENRSTIFNKIFSEGFKMVGFTILPMFIILITTFLPQIEYKNNAWKQVFTSPQTKATIFLSKFINVQLLVIAFMLASFILMLLAACILHFVHPSINVLSQPLNMRDIFVSMINCYVTILALCTLQFWFGLRFRNFIVPIAIGISMWVIGSMIVLEYKSSLGAYFPYSFHVYSVFPKVSADLNKVEWISAGYAIVFLILGFIDFNRGKAKSG